MTPSKNELDQAIKTLASSISCASKHAESKAVVIQLETARAALSAMEKERNREKGCDQCKHHCDTCKRMNADGICIVYDMCSQAKHKQKEWLHNRDLYRPYPFCRFCGRRLEEHPRDGCKVEEAKG